MVTVQKAFSYTAKNLSPRECLALALAALAGKAPMSKLAAWFGVSRKFVWRQARKANNFLDEAFAERRGGEEVLFYLPVTEEMVQKLVLGLVLICHSSFRGVVEFMRELLDVDISLGSVHSIVMAAVEKAASLNAAERLETVKVGAHDELFHAAQPVLVGADVASTYCYLLSRESSRSAETWALRLRVLSRKGLRPDYTIADGGQGLRAGQALAWPDIPCRADVFHVLSHMGQLCAQLDNRAFGAMSALEKTKAKMARGKKKRPWQQILEASACGRAQGAHGYKAGQRI